MITIIIPTYNDSQYLVKALDSCVNQNIEKEILIIDDCSTIPFPSEVNDIIAKYKEIKVIRHEINQGLSASRNTAIMASSSDYMIPLDADDWFYPNVLPAMYKRLTDNPHVDVVYGNLTQDGTEISYPIKEPFRKEHFLSQNPLFGSSMYRKRIWEARQPEYPLDGRYIVRSHAHYEDYNMWAKAFRNGFKFQYIDLLVYNHTLRSDSMLMKLHGQTGHFHKLAIEGVFE